MNVLKPGKKHAVFALLDRGLTQREIHRKTGIDRKTIRKYAGQYQQEGKQSKIYDTQSVATDSLCDNDQNPPPRPPGKTDGQKLKAHAKSACEPHRQWICEQIELGRNAVAIYQDLVERFGFEHKYNSVKRFVRSLKEKEPKRFDRLEFAPGEESQVDYGTGAKTLHPSGKFRKPRLFVMTLKYSRRAFRKVVWKSSKKVWAQLHEEAFRYFGGCTQYVVNDNLKEGVIKPDIYEPELNPVFEAVLAHYGVVADPARVRDPNRKGSVENAIQHTQNTALKGRTFESIEEQNQFLMHWEQRWAATRIHGRTKRQVQEMFEQEKPYLKELPLEAFKYFEQGVRTVSDDGTVQIGNSYYSALPARIAGKVVVRIYDRDIEIIDPTTLQIIRRHPKSARAGAFIMAEEDRIYNPSRQTVSLFNKAAMIGPETRKLCELVFATEGRSGQRRMQGIVNLARRYKGCHIEDACRMALEVNLLSYKSILRLVEHKAEKSEGDVDDSNAIVQKHRLIRDSCDYGAFWNQHARTGRQAAAEVTISRQNLPQVWQNASWHRVIEVFNLQVDQKRNGKSDEIWIKSPFTNENNASCHLNLKQNVFKDFSSAKGGGILNFCQDVLQLQGRSMDCYQVARWMLENKISSPPGGMQKKAVFDEKAQTSERHNRAIKADLCRWIDYDHPALKKRGICRSTCQYLSCGFLPDRRDNHPGSPLNGRLVFQIRGILRKLDAFVPVILSHVGRALDLQQEKSNGKYWSYPFFKGLEIYNQDKLLLDKNARVQLSEHGLILVEGFFDVAKLIEAGCLNVAGLMGAYMTDSQAERIRFIAEHVAIKHVTIFLDRDQAGRQGSQRALELLEKHKFSVRVFDWDQSFEKPDATITHIARTINDAADMSVSQIMWLRRQNIL